jgi:hypothetical protein
MEGSSRGLFSLPLEETHEKFQAGYTVTRQGFEPGTFLTQIHSVSITSAHSV